MGRYIRLLTEEMQKSGQKGKGRCASVGGKPELASREECAEPGGRGYVQASLALLTFSVAFRPTCSSQSRLGFAALTNDS